MKEFSGSSRFRRVELAVLLLAAAWVGFSGLFLAPFSWAQRKTEEITILHTNNVTGHLFGCPT